jgi:hypothetical protein
VTEPDIGTELGEAEEALTSGADPEPRTDPTVDQAPAFDLRPAL